MSVRLLLVAAGCLWLIGCAHQSADVAPSKPVEAPPKKPPAEIVIPRREGAPPVLVLPVQVRGAPLLQSELSRPRRAVARQLATQSEHPVDVMPLEEVDVVQALARSGQAHPEGPRCAATPTLPQALSRTHAGVLRAQPSFECAQDGCRIGVVLFEPGSGDQPPQRIVGAWSAPVAAPATAEGWEEAAQSLQTRAPITEPLQQPLNAEAIQAPYVPLVAVRSFGPWNPEPSQKAFEHAAKAFDACHVRGRVSRGTDGVVVAYSSSGGPVSCDVHTLRDPVVPELEACLCRAATQVQVGEGAEGRRVVLEARAHNDFGHTTDDGERITAAIGAFESSDPVLSRDRLTPTLPWLALCYASTRLERNISVPIRLSVSASGDVQQVAIEGEGSSQVLAPCLTGYLEHHAFPCTTADATATVSFTLKLDRFAQNVPTSAAPLPAGTSWTSTGMASSP